MISKIKKFISILTLLILIYSIYKPIFTYVVEIDVKGNKFLSKDEIIQSSELEKKIIFFNNQEYYARKITEILDIDEVKIIKNTYSKISIIVKERNFIFVVNEKNKQGLIDDKGLFHSRKNLKKFLNLPIFSYDSDVKIPTGLKILELIRENGLGRFFEVSEIKIDQILGIQIFTIQGQTFLIGKDNIKDKFEQLKLILTEASAINKVPLFVDLRESGKGVVKYNL